MIGDRGSDAQAGRNAGVRTIMIGNAEEDEKALADYCFPNFDRAGDYFFGKNKEH
jgi:phosphoglycolate phosphatase-like HAD superfamily hydrolase